MIQPQFNYLIEKIQETEFISAPFAHLYIEDFLSADHLHLLQTSPQLSLQVHESIERLLYDLIKQGYQIQKFPGCFTSTKQYLDWFNSNDIHCIDRSDVVESAGMAFRLMQIKNEKSKK